MPLAIELLSGHPVCLEQKISAAAAFDGVLPSAAANSNLGFIQRWNAAGTERGGFNFTGNTPVKILYMLYNLDIGVNYSVSIVDSLSNTLLIESGESPSDGALATVNSLKNFILSPGETISFTSDASTSGGRVQLVALLPLGDW